jgi:esterase/lipase superfamily enzyme
MPQPQPSNLNVQRVRHAWLRVVLAAGLALAWSGWFAAGLAQEATSVCRDATATPSSDDDVWLVSTRHLPGICRLPAAANVVVEHRGGDGRWHRSTTAELLSAADRPLVVFIHGNRYDTGDARQQGAQLARQLASYSPAAEPARTVIFSWPSEQQGILLKDGRAKHDRARADAHYLAWLLGQVEPTRPVAVVGYSFGAIISLGAMNDLVAAERAGRSDVQPWTHRAAATNFVLIAPAVRCDALAPQGPYRNSVECIDRLTLVINSRDDALRFFPLLERNLRADALGYVGMPRRWLPPQLAFTATDGAAIIGKHHGLPLYLASPTLTRTIASGVLDGLQ